MNTSVTGRSDFGRPAFLLVLVAAGMALCAALDLGVMYWVGVGAPGGKTYSFFEELVLLIAVLAVGGVAVLVSPERVRAAIPLFFAVLVWHTGFEITVAPDGTLDHMDGAVIVSVFDVIVPLLMLGGLASRWYRARGDITADIRRPLYIFGIFCFWGLVLALYRAVPFPPIIANLKAFAVYPLIAFLLPRCLTTWRQVYIASGVILALVFERALEGVRSHGVSSIAYLQNGSAVARATGNMTSPNQYAFYVMSGALIVIALVVAGRSQRLRLILAAPLAVMVLSIVLTLSRGAWLGFGIGLVVLALLLRLRRSALLPGAALIVVTLVNLLHPGTQSLITGRIDSRYGQGTIAERQDFLTLGLDVIRHYPLGAGWGAAFFRTPNGLTPGTTNVDWPWYHDDYLQLATEVGIPGLAVFLWLWLVLLRRGLRAYYRSRDTLQGALIVGLIASLVAMLVQAATDQIFWHADVGPHIWIIAGLLLAAATLVEQNPVEPQLVA